MPSKVNNKGYLLMLYISLHVNNFPNPKYSMLLCFMTNIFIVTFVIIPSNEIKLCIVCMYTKVRNGMLMVYKMQVHYMECVFTCCTENEQNI